MSRDVSKLVRDALPADRERPPPPPREGRWFYGLLGLAGLLVLSVVCSGVFVVWRNAAARYDAIAPPPLVAPPPPVTTASSVEVQAFVDQGLQADPTARAVVCGIGALALESRFMGTSTPQGLVDVDADGSNLFDNKLHRLYPVVHGRVRFVAPDAATSATISLPGIASGTANFPAGAAPVGDTACSSFSVLTIDTPVEGYVTEEGGAPLVVGPNEVVRVEGCGNSGVPVAFDGHFLMPASIDVCGLVVVRQRNGKEARSNPHRVQTGHGMITDSVALEAPKAP